MRVNENTLLEGNRAVLVPYRRAHVPRYHLWMQNEELQSLTASEPLTLEQEYDMQRSWNQDADKLTFIVLDRAQWNAGVQEEQCMMGDVNLFLTDPSDRSLAELEVMIAEPRFRGKGFGTEVSMMMMSFGISKLGIKKFQVKIGLENAASRALFQKLHFLQVSSCDVFKETTLELNVEPLLQTWILDQTSQVQERDYRESCKTRDQDQGPDRD
ncbi:alpha/beta-tubulin-N-acetyltransferase 9 [Eucyclogobius newberryi]|uniref:alpha/beta-tubulin-N-acetyltransferase 9 n=1 Tax=Eucyclogobius newberryi TaxID=166745 RepID=UPI003B5CF0AD